MLLLQGYYLPALILASLIIFNMVWNAKLQKNRRISYTEDSNIIVNLVRYSREYLITIKNYYEYDAQLAVLDPLFGEMMDVALLDIYATVPNSTILQDKIEQAIKNFLFDSIEMNGINNMIDDYDLKYKSRKKEIIEYLKSIGHPIVS
ncbi:MAG: hypothetical protein ABIE07_11695 [Candidatus Zixiibacteriota bacterium]